MKSIKEFINENINESKMTKFKSGLMKCKTFDKLFCYFNNIKSIDELTEDDFDAYDMGFVWFDEEGADLTFNDFIKKIKSYTGKKVTDIEIDDLGNTENLSFVCDNTSFCVDFVEND